MGCHLPDVPGYTFRVWVTNRGERGCELWRDYNGRDCVEQRIEELKHDLTGAGFCRQPSYATESAFPGGALHFQPAGPLPAPDHARRAVSAARDVAVRWCSYAVWC